MTVREKLVSCTARQYFSQQNQQDKSWRDAGCLHLGRKLSKRIAVVLLYCPPSLRAAPTRAACAFETANGHISHPCKKTVQRHRCVLR